MKYLKFIFIILTLSTMSIVTSSCSNDSNSTNNQGKEYTAAYICPMHCENSGSEEAGKCPVCGMDYVKNEDNKADGHTH